MPHRDRTFRGSTYVNENEAIDDIIHLTCGPIRVEVDDFGMLTARGIQYADCERFKSCTPVTPWTDIRDCTGPSIIPPQNPSVWEPVTGPLGRGREQHEDCLELTICSGPEIDDTGRAVMVFFHGGGYMTGGGDLDVYNPKYLARSADIVAVNISSRHGCFGYPPKLDGIEENLGLLDHVEALKWIRNNIEGFGGDPDQVTLYGHGEGADLIKCLMVCDMAKGLFHATILMSPPLGLRGDKFDEMRAEIVEMAKTRLADLKNDPSAPSTEELLAFQKEVSDCMAKKYGILTPFAPVFGVHPLPPEDEALDRLVEATPHIRTMIGWTADEYKNKLHSEPDSTIDMFKKAADELEMAEDYVKIGIACASYIFKWHPEQSVMYKAVHGIELPFLLGNWEAWKEAPMLWGGVPDEIRKKIGGNMRDLWTDFALGEDVGDVRFVIDENFKYKD